MYGTTENKETKKQKTHQLRVTQFLAIASLSRYEHAARCGRMPVLEPFLCFAGSHIRNLSQSLATTGRMTCFISFKRSETELTASVLKKRSKTQDKKIQNTRQKDPKHKTKRSKTQDKKIQNTYGNLR